MTMGFRLGVCLALLAATISVADVDTYRNRFGILYEGGAGSDPDGFAFTVGGEQYASEWLSNYLGLSWVGNEGLSEKFPVMFGFSYALRLNVPWVISPFAGVGVWGGYADHTEEQDASDDGVDNDNDGRTDEAGETEPVITDAAVAAAVYPEAGLHIWLNPGTRVSVFGRYYVGTGGRESDFWICGMSLCFQRSDK